MNVSDHGESAKAEFCQSPLISFICKIIAFVNLGEAQLDPHRTFFDTPYS